MATSSSDCSARVYDVRTDFKELAVMRGHREEVSKVSAYIHTYIPLTLYPEGVAEASRIFLSDATFYQNCLAMRNTADVTGGKPIAV
jgi:WD40 repeat protein